VSPSPELPVYLDCNASTPIEPEVLEAVSRCFRDHYGNSGSRTHGRGLLAKRAVERARAQVAKVVGAVPDEVIFTSGATESNNLALLGLADHGIKTGRQHIVSTAIEHKSVLGPLAELARRGFEIELLKPCAGGWVTPDSLLAALRTDTLLVSIMQVNNETGVRQPIEDLCSILSGHAAFLHVDAAQGYGKELDTLQRTRIDLISVSAHKIFGPQGVGALIARRRMFERVPLRALQYGGGQERGLRPGTIAVPLVVGLGEASAIALRDISSRQRMCAAIQCGALRAFEGLPMVLNGDAERLAPNTLNVSFNGVDSEATMVALKGVAEISNGSACTSQDYQPSHVLQAMGLEPARIAGAIRFSWSHLTGDVDWPAITERLLQLGICARSNVTTYSQVAK